MDCGGYVRARPGMVTPSPRWDRSLYGHDIRESILRPREREDAGEECRITKVEVVVVSAWHPYERRSSDGFGNGLSHPVRDDLVLVAMDDQRRHVDARSLREGVETFPHDPAGWQEP